MGKNKKLILPLCLLIFSIGFLFLFPKPVFGSIGSLVANIISAFLELICSFFGQLTAWIIGFIAKVAQYNNFGRTQVVNKGWEILRDLANMFFILGFLVIAFATVLKIEKYSYKRLLFPLLLMALLVNFSRTICLLVIDFAQVIMLSFVNAFKDIGAGNLAQLLGIESVITLKAPGVGGQLQQTGLSGWDLTLAWLLGTVMMFIALVVSLIILVILIMRIIAIWILLVLSPLAFILYIIPGGQRYVSIWQSKFINQVIIGPILAFFLWLAFYAVQQGNITQGIPMENFDTSVIKGAGDTSIEAAKPNVFASFIVGIGLLIGALLATRELGVAGASLAGKGIGFLQKVGKKAVKAGIRPIKGAVTGIRERIEAATGITLSPKEWIEGYKRAMEIRREARKMRKLAVAREKGWAVGSPADFFQQYWSWKGLGRQLRTFFMPQRLGEKYRKEAESHREEAKKWEETSKRLTAEEKNKKLDKLEEEIEAKTEEHNYVITQRIGKVIDLTLPENVEMVQGLIKSLREKATEMRIRGKVDLAEKYEYDAEELEKGIKDKETRFAITDRLFSGEAKGGIFRWLNSQQEKLKNELNQLHKTYEEIKKAPTITERMREDAIKRAAEARKAAEEAEQKRIAYSPQFIDARLEETALIAKASQRLAGISDYHTLNEMVRVARERKDWALFSAATIKNAQNYNENEQANSLGYTSDMKGIMQMLRDFGKACGVGEQAILSLAEEIGHIAQQTHHWPVAKLVKMEGGRFKELTEEEHVLGVVYEASKREPGLLGRVMSRLSIGYEDPYTRKWHPLPEGLLIIKLIEEQIAQRPHEINPNLISYAGRPEVIEVLKKIDVLPQALDNLKKLAKTMVKKETLVNQILEDWKTLKNYFKKSP